jgi:cardiolipin synthase (CMP-forming)
VRQILTAPNQLTLLRMIFVPLILISVMDRHWKWALALFIVAGFSDGLDGLLARKLHQRTQLGEYLDPIADKVLLSSLFLVLAFRRQIPWKFTVMVFSRDFCILITCALLYAVVGLRDFRPSVFGKANTFAQIGALFFVLLHQITPAPSVALTKTVLLWSTFVLTTISGIHYVFLAGHRIKSGERARPSAAM